MPLKTAFLNTLLVATFAATAGAPALLAAGTIDATWQEAKTKFFTAFDKQTVTVPFKAGSAAVNSGELSDLKALVKANSGDHKTAKVIVAAWADKDYPTGKGAALSDADRRLAAERAAKIKAALKKLGVASVDTYTMAEQPTWLSKAFNLKDSKVKGEGTSEGAEDAYVTEVGQKLRDKGGPGKAVVYVSRAGEAPAH